MPKKTKENDYDVLEQAIGNMGGEPGIDANSQADGQGQDGLGRLQHAASYGAKEGLTGEERSEMNAFLERQRKAREARESDEPEQHQVRVISDHTPIGVDDDTLIADGWIPLDRKSFGVRSKFYPADWEFYIHPAVTQAIKNWIGIDEKNAIQMNRTFDEIIKLCVKIKSGAGTVSWSRINTWDRFWLILKVREATFASNKKTITFEDSCSECDQDITFELTPSALHYEFPDEDIVEKHWNAEDMVWEIDLSEYGVDDHEPIKLHTPTLAVQQAIIDWAGRQNNRGKKIDETFASVYLPWLIDRVLKDEVQFDKKVQKLEKEYKSWSVGCHQLITDIIRNITINPKETLKTVCPHCGEEVVSNVQFPNGIKVLFETETRVQKFGTR